MAQRFGGKFSPGDHRGDDTPARAGAPRNKFTDARPATAGARVNILFALPLFMAFRAFTSEPVVLAQWIGALVLLLFSAWLTREGLKAQDAYEARSIAKRPAIPRKIFGSVTMGLGLLVAGIAGHGLIDGVIFGALGAALHLFAFGPDPMRDKGAEGIDAFQTERVARVIDEAEEHLRVMTTAIERVGDRAVTRRVADFQATARAMFRSVEDDPRDLTATRKFLGVYLLGARDATLKFADLYTRQRDAQDRDNYLALLDDLDGNFAAKTDKLMSNNRTDMDIEIKVLRDRLAREGVVGTGNEG
ncbi:MAG: 5-bromo-4-chloroindolyl phosphate hydrolysis family protein [Pseudomonadota bacterium]